MERSECRPENGLRLLTLLGMRDSWLRTAIRVRACRLANSPGFDAGERPDLEQELLLEIVRRHERFDPRRGAETTFVARILDNRVRSLARSRGAAKRRHTAEAGSLDEQHADGARRRDLVDDSDSRRHTGRAIPDVTDLQIDLVEVVDRLPPDLRDLANQLGEATRHRVAARTGRSRRRMARDVARLRSLFEDAGLREYL